MEKIKAAVVGVGSISQIVHLPILLGMEDVEIKAICDLDLKKANAIAQKFHIPAVYELIDNMVRKEDLDVIFICTTSLYHFPMSYLALNSGIHVFVEKPIALNSEDAGKLAVLAKKQKKHIMTGMQHRFRDDVQTLKEFIHNNELGDLFYIKAGWLKKWSRTMAVDWQTKKQYSGGGVLIDLGIQLLDLAMYITGMPEIHSVRLYDYKLNPGIKVEDAALALIRTESNVIITLEMGWRMHLEKDLVYANFFGNKGAAYLNPLRINKELHGNLVNVTPMSSESSIERYKSAYEKEIRHFFDVIQGKETNQSSAEDSVQIMRIIEALYKSSNTGDDVRIG